MPTLRRVLSLSILIVSFVVLSFPVFAQQVIATVPVGLEPDSSAVNTVTNKIYVANQTCPSYPCLGNGTVTVIDGATNNTLSVNVGYSSYGMAVNPATNKMYVPNSCGNDPNCLSGGTVSVIDGASNTVIATVTVESQPYAAAVNSATNRIYVLNSCGADLSCSTFRGTVSVIDGVSNTVVATVPVGVFPLPPVVNTVTNKIYVPNACGNDPCAIPNGTGTVTVIDGATNNSTSVKVGIRPFALDVNTVTNKIYVANQCGDDPSCNRTATMTVIDGATLATTDVPIGGYLPSTLAVNSVTNKIYVPDYCGYDPSCQREFNGTMSVIDGGTLTYTSIPVGVEPDTMAVNSVTNKMYVANRCGIDPSCQNSGTVTIIDGTTSTFTNIGVGHDPQGLSLNSVTNRVYVPNFNDDTVSVIADTPPTALQFVPLTAPCRAVDTRPDRGGNGPIVGGTFQNFPIQQEGDCNIPPTAAAYSLNVSVVPNGPLGYLTVWPAGQPQPLASTLNSLDGRIKANAAIVPAGAGGDVSVYATNTTNVILDVNGYFTKVNSSTLAFYPLPPCRVADTRFSTYPPGLGPPYLRGNQERDFSILNATTCNIPSTAVAYSLNFAVVPRGPLGYMTVWPTGEPRPTVSSLNDIPAQIIANAAIVGAGTGSKVAVYPSNDTDLVIDINGYFASAGTGGLSLYGVSPCRVIDTRKIGSGQPFNGLLSPPVDVVNSPCEPPPTAQAYVFNASVVPVGALGYLALWPDGASQPLVSTLNALDGSISSNMAIVPSTNGKVDAYASGLTQLILDISGYFAP